MTLNGKKITIITHVYSPGPPHELEAYLKDKVEELFFITHPLPFVKGKPSHYKYYRKGKLVEDRDGRVWNIPDLLRYFKDFLANIYLLWSHPTSDLIIALDNLNATSALVLRILGKAKQVVFYTIDYIPERFPSKLLNSVYHGLDNFCVRQADYVWNLSPVMVAMRTEKGIEKRYEAKQLTVPIGTHLNMPDIKKDPKLIVFMGHLREGQGAELLIDAMPLILKSDPKIHLRFIGGGPLQEKLEAQAKQLKVDQAIEFTGFVPTNEAMRTLLAEGSLALAPYVDDDKTFTRYTDPGKPKEYLAARLPVIITPVPQFAQVIAKQKAGKVVACDKQSVADAVTELIASKELAAYQHNAYELAKDYAWPKLFETVFATMDEVVSHMKRRQLFTLLLSMLPYATTGILILVAVLLPIFWIEPGHILFRGDPVAALNPALFFIERFSLWNGKINLGVDSGVPIASLVHQFIQAFPAFFGADDRIAEIFHFSFWLALPGLTMAFFMHIVSRQYKISCWMVPVATALYLFNPYRVAMFGDNNHFAVYALLPFAFGLISLASAKPALTLSSAAAFALSTLLLAQAGTNPPMYLMFWLPVLFYGAIVGLTNYRASRPTLLFWAVSLFGTLALNLFWIVPFAQTLLHQTGLGSAGNLNWLDDLSRHTNFSRVVRMIGAWEWFDTWKGAPYAPYAQYYSLPFYSALALIPAGLAVLALFLTRGRNQLTNVLLITGSIALVFSQGVHPPFEQFYRWCVEHIPFFWTFRSPWYKFTNIYVFAVASLVGIAVGYVMNILTGRKIFQGVMIVLVLTVPFLLSAPFFNGSRWQGAKDVSSLPPDLMVIPSYIDEAAEWLNSQPGNTAVGLLPYQGAAIYRWGYASPVDPLYYKSRRPIFFRGDRIGYTPGETPGATIMYRIFKERLYSEDPVAAQIARLMGLEYLVIRNDIDYTFYDDQDSPEFLRNKLSYQSAFSRVQTFGEWDIYQLKDAAEVTLYATTKIESYDGHPVDGFASIVAAHQLEGQIPSVVFSRPVKQPDPALAVRIMEELKGRTDQPQLVVQKSLNQYRITGNEDSPFLLVLNQSFNPSWIARMKNGQVSQPIIVNGYQPAWLIQPTGKFEIEVSYGPQRYVKPLLLLALVAVGVLVVLVWFGLRKTVVLQRN